MRATPDDDVLDESLSRLAATGPEFGGGLSNHGPMAAEALVRLGRAEDVEPWLDGYIKRLDEAPRPAGRITDWREALGHLNRVAEWELYFRDQLADAPWQGVLARWWPRLLPGLAAASREPAPGLITEVLKAGLAGDARFPAAVGALRPPSDAGAGLRDLATTFSRIFLAYQGQRPIALLHAVTAPVAARSVLPLLPAELARPTHDALWQVAAALYTVYAGGVVPEPGPATSPPDPGALADRAVATGDAHAIKLTEACLRLHEEAPGPVLLHAANHASELLGRR
jgi:hypothetical protein